MLETLKEMQKQGIFKLLPNDDLDVTISSSSSSADIVLVYDSIQKYLKKLSRELAYKHNVDLGRTLSDFSDKFSYEMFDMAFTCTNHSNGIYQKEITYGEAGNGSFGIEMFNATFNLEERKLLKLLNHYYISLINKENFADDYYFIPFDSLRLIFPKVNNIKLKEKIIDTCNRLNSKVVYWDFSKTRYNKKLEQCKLNTGKKEKIVDLSILYFPKKNKNGINGEAIEIKGIICRINKFMKLRFELKQISNRFPVESLGCNYLSFVIAEKMDYRFNMMKLGNKNALTEYDKDLRDLTDEIYLYRNREQQRETYLFQIANEPNSKDSILNLLEAITTVLNNLLENNMSFTAVFKVQRKELNLRDYLANIRKATKKREVEDQINELYNDIISIGKFGFEQAQVRYLISTGNISLILKF